MPLPRKERRDAVRHTAALLDAATRVFGAHGVHVSLDGVIEAAGVGRATFYRRFPDRTALLLALLDRELDRLETAVAEASTDEAFTILLNVVADRPLQMPALAEGWRAIEPHSPALRQRHARFLAIAAGPLAAAQDAGLIRPDLKVTEITVIVRMAGAAMRHGEDLGGLTSARILDFLLRGVAAG